ncbi:hypothetical protein CLF_110153 [Clonorchis sinensis]|uniref:Uncharacterized protein n=1 Tax=Clonorchis sinensis TaxID=79923 RepID=G7YKC4_CLOSI|nr:hypothetical protein CLF_110153 [Clonorchis sinensis]
MLTQANNRRKKAGTISAGQLGDHVRTNTIIVGNSMVGYQASFRFAALATFLTREHHESLLCTGWNWRQNNRFRSGIVDRNGTCGGHGKKKEREQSLLCVIHSYIANLYHIENNSWWTLRVVVIDVLSGNELSKFIGYKLSHFTRRRSTFERSFAGAQLLFASLVKTLSRTKKTIRNILGPTWLLSSEHPPSQFEKLIYTQSYYIKLVTARRRHAKTIISVRHLCDYTSRQYVHAVKVGAIMGYVVSAIKSTARQIVVADAKEELRIWLSSKMSFPLHHEKSAQNAFAVQRMIRHAFSRITLMDF